MHWLTRICKASPHTKYRRIPTSTSTLYLESRRNFHRKDHNHSPIQHDLASAKSKNVDSIESSADGDAVVISGISGRFPQTDNMKELKHCLNNGIDMVTENNRFDKITPKIPSRMGTLKSIDKFDASFFNITNHMAECMDINMRILLEVCYEAMFDAGVNPSTMRNTKTGVYIGTVGGESTEYWTCKGAMDELEGYKVLGIPNFFQPGRVSYHLDLKGPSMAINTGCSAGLIALETAMFAMKEGTCDQAIVAGSQIHMSQYSTLELTNLSAVSPDGRCKVFDDAANGFARAEAIVAILVQRKRDAKRHYVTVRGIRSNSDGFKREGLTFPSSLGQEVLLRETYAVSGIDPGQVKYFEAHGTGTAAGDPQELTAIAKVMAQAPTRKEPLLLGSVKSNLGHTESTAGLSGLAKICIAIEQGVIPANLHFKNLNSHVKHLFDGSLKIVDQPTPWEGGLIGLSSYGLAGSNIHVILESGPRTIPANIQAQKDLETREVPILIPFSGRSEALLKESLTEACEMGQKNSEARGLLHEAFRHNIPNHGFRGYGLFLPGQEEPPLIAVDKRDMSEKRPLWFIFPGMGSQWNEMGKDLMKLDAYAESIKSSQITLKNVGVDLEHLLRPNNPTIFDNIRDSLVAITAVQVALYDTLTSMGLKPDGFVGHSSGEILCAYADGCMSAEEALLVGNARGRSFHESVSAPGGMASVGLTWEEATKRCPPGIYPACHNAAENVSISGPLEDIQNFTKLLQSEGIFARQVNSCLCAPHSKYVYPATQLLFKYMNEIFQDDRPRSSKWISSSIPESEWDSPLAKTSSSAYHVNNMQSPVLFHDAVLKVPKNAVVIEIAPRGLFQPLLRGTLNRDCTLIAPMHHSVEDKLNFFLSSVGKMYNAGVNLNVGKLYPEVKFPVSSSAPTISSLIKWDHERSWRVHALRNYKEDICVYSRVDLGERKHGFLDGHKLDSRCVFPATGYLVMAWRSFGATTGCYYMDLPIAFENVSLERATFLKDDKSVCFKSSFHIGNQSFVIEDEGTTVVKGKIWKPEEMEKLMFQVAPIEIPSSGNSKRKSLNADDVYKEFRLRGYNYTGEFRGIRNIDNEGKWAQIAWRGNWISFLDTMLQTIVLSILTRCTAVPVRIKSICIDPKKFMEYVRLQEESLAAAKVEAHLGDDFSPSVSSLDPEQKQKYEILIPVSIYSHLGTIKCPGIEFRGLTAMVIPRQKQKETLSVEEYNFCPLINQDSNNNSSLNSTVAEVFDLALENIKGSKLKIVDCFTQAENSLTNSIIDLVSLKPKHKAELTMLSTQSELEKLEEKIKNLANTVSGKETVEKLVPDAGIIADLVFLDDSSLLGPFSERIQDNSYVILNSKKEIVEIPASLRKISEKDISDRSLSLFRKISLERVNPIQVQNLICIDNPDFNWLPTIQSAMASLAKNDNQNSRVYLYSQNNPESGILGLTKCLRLEEGGEKLRCIFDPEGKLNLNEQSFKSPSKELKEILEQDLVTNVYKNGRLGSYRHIPMSQDASYPSKEVTHAYVNTITTGDLTSLRWVESPLTLYDPKRDAAKGKVVTVHYAALNFRDIMLATGKLPVDSKSAFNPQDCIFGFEFSGVDESGERVMGVMGSKAMASSVLIGPDAMTWPIPKHWSLAEAATTPVVYATVYYGFFMRAGILPGQSVLIHAGTGGVGQAAINVALDLNCEIFTTVGTEEKKEYIQKMFPSLKKENIGNSRDCSFEQQILELTNGKGVDIVLNSLADDKLQAGVRCLALHGKFIEIGSFDSFQNSNLGMECFLKDVGFEGVKLNHFLGKPRIEKEALGKLFTDGIERGVVKPLPRTVYENDQIEEAFRFMASGKHMGKVLIEVQNEDKIGQKPKLKAVPRSYFSPEKSYIIIGGLGGMGLELANWLVDRGARHLILTSRSGVTTGYQELCLRKWEEQNVKVETPKIDLSLYDIAEKFIQNLTSNSKHIGGIFNSGLVLKDGPIEDQTFEDFKAVAAPKTIVTQNLDKLTRKYCDENLDYFVVFSSMACGRGNASQSNYGLANSVMEQICDNRKNDGLHGLAIQWGVIGEVGAVAEGIFGAKLTGEEVFDGTLAQRINSCLDVLDMTLHQNASTVSSMVLAEDDGMRAKRIGLLETISHICGIKDMSNITPTTKLVDLGMDSLVGMEIKQLIERDYDTPLTAHEIRTMTFNDLIMIEAGTYVKGQGLKQGQEEVKSKGIDLIEVLKGGYQKILVRLTSEISEEDVSDGTKKLFIVHGIEGHSNVFSDLAEKLSCHVFGFQFPPREDKSIGSLAKEYIQELKKIQPEGPYQLAGYSGGGAVVFEMAQILENEYQEKVENVIFLDSCCVWNEVEHDDDVRFVAQGLMGVASNTVEISPEENEKIVEILSKDDSKAGVNILVEVLKEKFVNIEADLVTKYFQNTLSFFDMCRHYETSARINGKVTLIKASEKTHIMTAVKDEKHYLQKYCKEDVSTFTVNGDHSSFLREENVAESANIINNILIS